MQQIPEILELPALVAHALNSGTATDVCDHQSIETASV